MSNLVLRNLFPTRDDLFYPFQSFFDKFYDELIADNAVDTMRKKANYPRWDVYEGNGTYSIEASLPGLEAEDVTVEVLPDQGQGRWLKMTGRVNQQYQRSDDVKYYVRELRRSAFERYHRLPDYVRGDPQADMANGVLSLQWKIEDTKPKPKTIPINKGKPAALTDKTIDVDQ